MGRWAYLYCEECEDKLKARCPNRGYPLIYVNFYESYCALCRKTYRPFDLNKKCSCNKFYNRYTAGEDNDKS